jgi:hypothetical protein
MTTPWARFEHKPLEQQWREVAASRRQAVPEGPPAEPSPSAPLPKKPSAERARQMAAAKADRAERVRQIAAAAVDGAEKAKQIADQWGWIVSGQTK